jgi:hypothetical protein
MSLFVGNISKYVRKREFEDEFLRFGKCDIKQPDRVTNAFSLTFLRNRLLSSNLKILKTQRRPWRSFKGTTWEGFNSELSGVRSQRNTTLKRARGLLSKDPRANRILGETTLASTVENQATLPGTVAAGKIYSSTHLLEPLELLEQLPSSAFQLLLLLCYSLLILTTLY